jgi:hypothetical protein
MSNTARSIVIDFDSIVSNSEKHGNMLKAELMPGTASFIKEELARGSTIFIITGKARDPFWRSIIERFLQANDIRSCFVTHALPDHFDLFLSTNAVSLKTGFPK